MSWIIFPARELKDAPSADPNSGSLRVLNAGDALATLLHDVNYEKSLLRDYLMTSPTTTS